MADVVDLLEDSPEPAAPEPPTEDRLRQAGHCQWSCAKTSLLNTFKSFIKYLIDY